MQESKREAVSGKRRKGGTERSEEVKSVREQIRGKEELSVCVVYICFKTVQILSSHPDVDFFWFNFIFRT